MALNFWKVTTICLAIVWIGSIYFGGIVKAQKTVQRAHITTVSGQKTSPTSHLPYIANLDDIELPLGQIKSFSCLEAVGKDFDGKDVHIPQCFVLTQ